MINEEKRTVTMSREDMLKILHALSRIVVDIKNDVRCADNDEKRFIAKGALYMWQRIHNDFVSQLDEQDPLEWRI